jgi:hypothetical protein
MSSSRLKEVVDVVSQPFTVFKDLLTHPYSCYMLAAIEYSIYLLIVFRQRYVSYLLWPFIRQCLRLCLSRPDYLGYLTIDLSAFQTHLIQNAETGSDNQVFIIG